MIDFPLRASRLEGCACELLSLPMCSVIPGGYVSPSHRACSLQMIGWGSWSQWWQEAFTCLKPTPSSSEQIIHWINMYYLKIICHTSFRENVDIRFLSYSKVRFEIESMLWLLSVGLIKSLSYVKGTRASVFFSICHSCSQFSRIFPIPPLLLSYTCSKASILSKLKGLFLHTTFQSAACNLLWSVLLHLGARSEP